MAKIPEDAWPKKPGEGAPTAENAMNAAIDDVSTDNKVEDADKEDLK